MTKEKLKDWCNTWEIEDIVSSLTSAGMEYMANVITLKELKAKRKVFTREIKRRIKFKIINP